MLDVVICIGSSCHLKGSYDVLDRIQSLTAKHKLTDQVNIKASFCMGECTNSVCVTISGQIFKGVNLENVDALFAAEIAPHT